MLFYLLFSVIYNGLKSFVQRSFPIFISEVAPKLIALADILKISFSRCLTKSNHERFNELALRADEDRILLNLINDLTPQESRQLNGILITYGQIVNRINLNNNRNNLKN